tara:strand:+ start:1112 stop:1312 length:201 start_codon:yes stop_codon:yes gene_type:complete
MKRKSIFISKTAAAAFLTTAAGLAATFLPGAGDFIASNAGAILIGLGVVNFVLRLVTKEKVELFPG